MTPRPVCSVNPEKLRELYDRANSALQDLVEYVKAGGTSEWEEIEQRRCYIKYVVSALTPHSRAVRKLWPKDSPEQPLCSTSGCDAPVTNLVGRWDDLDLHMIETLRFCAYHGTEYTKLPHYRLLNVVTGSSCD